MLFCPRVVNGLMLDGFSMDINISQNYLYERSPSDEVSYFVKMVQISCSANLHPNLSRAWVKC